MLRWLKRKLWWRKYRRYLKSEKWKHIRNEVLVRDHCSCQECGNKKPPLQVHHKSYEFVFREKKNLNTLITLCEKCHKREHKKAT